MIGMNSIKLLHTHTQRKHIILELLREKCRELIDDKKREIFFIIFPVFDTHTAHTAALLCYCFDDTNYERKL